MIYFAMVLAFTPPLLAWELGVSNNGVFISSLGFPLGLAWCLLVVRFYGGRRSCRERSSEGSDKRSMP